ARTRGRSTRRRSARGRRPVRVCCGTWSPARAKRGTRRKRSPRQLRPRRRARSIAAKSPRCSSAIVSRPRSPEPRRSRPGGQAWYPSLELSAPRFCPICETETNELVCARDAIPTISPELYERERNTMVTGAVLGGRYRLDGVIGEGGNGVVFRATQLALSRE